MKSLDEKPWKEIRETIRDTEALFKHKVQNEYKYF